MKIYLAGPISGKSYAEVVNAYQDKIDILNALGYETLCPMTGKQYLRNETNLRAHSFTNPVSTNHAIFERDKWMVESCDIILADLSQSGDRVSIGTMMELAWAAIKGKHTIVVNPDGNVHNHAFVYEAADITVATLEDAYNYLRDLVSEL